MLGKYRTITLDIYYELFDNYVNAGFEFKEFYEQQIEKSIYDNTIEYAKHNNICPEFDENSGEFIKYYSSNNYRIYEIIHDELNYIDEIKKNNEYRDNEYNQDILKSPKLFINRIINGEIDINKIAMIPSPDLYPRHFEKTIEEINKRKNIKLDKKISMNYICPQCKQIGAYILHFQGNACDELSKVRKQCAHCSKVF